MRKTSEMCSIQEIVEYWEKACYKDRTERLPTSLDLGEPTCFACGEYWKGKFDNRQGYAGWKAAPLERAHIIPHSLSGSNDDPSNFVMLCEKCHPLNPHTKSRAVYMKWLHSVKPNREILLRKLTEDWFPNDVREKYIEEFTLPIKEELKKFNKNLAWWLAVLRRP